jgi:hypothetical protein
MASQLKVDTLTGVTTAGSIVVTGEGNSTTTNLQQGLCKVWHNSTDAASVNDSLNVSGSTDNGTADYSYAFTNAFGNIHPAISGICTEDDRNTIYVRSRAADNYRVRLYGHDDAFADMSNAGQLHGDLA